VGTARWRIKDGNKIKLERFAVLKDYRGKNIGKALVQSVLADLPEGFEVMLHAQTHALEFYGKMGFEAYGDLFEEAGIQHYAMRLTNRNH
jgi:predicted GNAT family N-acyltransferase